MSASRSPSLTDAVFARVLRDAERTAKARLAKHEAEAWDRLRPVQGAALAPKICMPHVAVPKLGVPQGYVRPLDNCVINGAKGRVASS